MKRLARRSTFAALAATTALGGCSTGTGPGVVEAEYALQRVGDRSLPFRVANETWIADTIRFHEADRWSRVQVVTLHAEGASPDPVQRTQEGFLTYQGARIVLDFECNDVILARSCIAPDTVELAGSDLVRAPNHYGVSDVELPLFHYEPVGP